VDLASLPLLEGEKLARGKRGSACQTCWHHYRSGVVSLHPCAGGV